MELVCSSGVVNRMEVLSPAAPVTSSACTRAMYVVAVFKPPIFNCRASYTTTNQLRSYTFKSHFSHLAVIFARAYKSVARFTNTTVYIVRHGRSQDFLWGCTFFLTKNLMTFFLVITLSYMVIYVIILPPTTFLSHLRGCTSPNSAPFLPQSNKNA